MSRNTSRAIVPTLCVAMAALGCSDGANSPTGPAAEPVNTVATTSAVLTFRQISAGDYHTCGVTTDNKAYCWGAGEVGELGNGKETSSSRPVAVAGDLRFLRVNAGSFYTCGVTTDNRIYCWGYNSVGNLGDGTQFSRSRPTTVVGNRRWSQVDAGDRHTCGLTIDHKAYCWGDNFVGELGNGTNTGPELCVYPFGDPCSTRPVAVVGGHLFRQVSAGTVLTCGVSVSFQAFCWGIGPLGTGTSESESARPLRVLTTRQFMVMRAGSRHSCGLTTDNQAFCWGYDELGQLGNGTHLSPTAGAISVPVRVVGGHAFSGLSVDAGPIACATTPDNRAFCWGSNGFGELGNGSHTGPETCIGMPCSTRPIAVAGGLLFKQVDVGQSHSCGVTTDGQAFCWGTNLYGELGNGTNTGPEMCPAETPCSTRPAAVVALGP